MSEDDQIVSSATVRGNCHKTNVNICAQANQGVYNNSENTRYLIFKASRKNLSLKFTALNDSYVATMKLLQSATPKWLTAL